MRVRRASCQRRVKADPVSTLGFEGGFERPSQQCRSQGARAKASAGVRQSRILRGRSFSRVSIAVRSADVAGDSMPPASHTGLARVPRSRRCRRAGHPVQRPRARASARRSARERHFADEPSCGSYSSSSGRSPSKLTQGSLCVGNVALSTRGIRLRAPAGEPTTRTAMMSDVCSGLRLP